MKVGLVLFVGLLAACTAPRETFVAARPGEIGSSRESGLLVLHEASDGLVPVVIRGDPFAGRLANPSASVADLLRLPPGFPRARFVETAEAEGGERLVLVFDAKAPHLVVSRLCRDLSGVELGEPGTSLTAAAAYCIGQRMARGAVGGVPRPDSLSTEFKRFVDRLLGEVFTFPSRFRL